MLQTELIQKSIEENKEVKVYFNDQTRTPMIGHFVCFENPNQVRFVAQSRWENYLLSNKHVSYTRLHNISNFQFVQLC